MYYEDSSGVNDTTTSFDDFSATLSPSNKSDPICEHCRKSFGSRNGRGGSAQRFCSATCRKSHHNAQRQHLKRLNETLVKSPASQTETLRDAEKSETLATTEPAPAPAAKIEDPDKFDWFRDREDIVVRQQMPIAVYHNPHGDVVIRQQGEFYEEDKWIVIECHNLVPLISRLQAFERGE
jgi:hypothetical protein